MANFTKSWEAHIGLNHTPAYQVSGIPFASGNCIPQRNKMGCG